MTLWVLDAAGNAVPADFETWARWFQVTDRKLAEDRVDGGRVRVSTVFLGIDHQMMPGGPPVLWETMIFGGPHDDYQERYATREAAGEGHARALALALAAVPTS